MYVVLNKFLLSHQSLDFRRVPEFFKLFYGFDLEVRRYIKQCFCFLTVQVINQNWESYLAINQSRTRLVSTTFNLLMFVQAGLELILA